MPRVRAFRDPKTIRLIQRKPKQLTRLLLLDGQKITTSRLPASSIDDLISSAQNAHTRQVNRRGVRLKGLVKSPNDGQIIAVKDNFVTRDLPATCASHVLEGFSAEDATVVQLLKRAGMTVVAKTNMDEFGMGSHSTNSAYGTVEGGTKNEPLSVGGSSGGSAIAVAAGIVDSALGSDTGGSVRLPAAYTGIVGFKPSYGMISRKGLVPYANSLDTVGLFGRSTLDVWLLWSILNQYDHQDPTSLSDATRQRIHETRRARVERDSIFSFETIFEPSPAVARDEPEGSRTTIPPKVSNLAGKKVGARRVGVPIEYNIQELHPVVRNAWIRTLSNLQYFGHEIVPVSLPSTQQALSAYYVLAPAEAASNLAKYDGVRYGKLREQEFIDDAAGALYAGYRGEHFGEEVQRRVLLGSYTLSAGAIDNYFVQAQKVRRIVQNDFDLVFKMVNPLRPKSYHSKQGVDYIICPTAPTPPPRLSHVEKFGPLDSYINDVFTVPASLAGLPAISVPASPDSKVASGHDGAIGMQVIGQFGDDTGVIQFARTWMEREHDPHRTKQMFHKQLRLM